MNWLDLVIVAVVAWLTFSAFSSGLIREFVTIAAVIGGAVLAGQFYERLAANIAFLVSDDALRSFVAFVAIFGGIAALGQIAAIALRQAAAMLMLGPLDRIGGAAFGLLKGLLLVQVLLIAATTYSVSPRIDAAIEGSALATAMLDHVPGLLRLLPDEFSQAIETARALAEQLPVPQASPIR